VTLVALRVQNGFDIANKINLRFEWGWQFFLSSLKYWGDWSGKQKRNVACKG
jgi:hypothetical protein